MTSGVEWEWWNYSLVAIGLLGMAVSLFPSLRTRWKLVVLVVVALLFVLWGTCNPERESPETPESVTLLRPYFTLIYAGIQNTSRDLRTLVISVQNNTDVPANEVVDQLLILEKPLDLTIEPLHKKTITEANPQGPSGILSRRLSFNPKRSMPPSFVLFQIRYNSYLSNETHLQSWYLKFSGVIQDEIDIEQLLNNATKDEKIRIERYMKERKIPML